MMKNILLLLFSLFLMNGFSQEPCGTYVSEESMQQFYQRDRSHLNNNLKAGSIIDIPIVYHIARQTDGFGVFTKENALRLHCELNEDFQNADINFYLVDIIYHDNTNYYNMIGPQGNGNNMMNTLNNPDVCNVYVVNDAKSGNTTVCGYSYVPMFYPGPNRGGIVIDINCADEGDNTYAHEMGHYLNLPHTFYRWEGSDYTTSPIPTYLWERADGSNCATTGDGFCDTPADYISSRWDCTLPEIFQDAIGTTFQVDEKNYMSYSLDGCKVYFKNDQIAEMKNTPVTYRSYLTNLTMPTIEVTTVPTLILPLSNGQNVSPDTVKFEWSEVQNADYYLLQLLSFNSGNVLKEKMLDAKTNHTFYNLNANTNYKWQVKGFTYGKVCTNYEAGTFKTATFEASVSVDDVFCTGANDGNAYAQANLNVNSYEWYKFNSMTNAYTVFNTTTTNVVHALAPGNYLVEIISAVNGNSLTSFSVFEPVELENVLTLSNNTIIANVSGGTPPYSYLWSNGETTQTNFNPVLGNNSLYFSDSNSCNKASSFNYINDDTLVVETVFNIEFYPNPVKGNYLFINVESIINTKILFELYNLEGNLLKSQTNNLTINENLLNIEIKNFSKGVYFLKTTISNHTITKKIIL